MRPAVSSGRGKRWDLEPVLLLALVQTGDNQGRESGHRKAGDTQQGNKENFESNHGYILTRGRNSFLPRHSIMAGVRGQKARPQHGSPDSRVGLDGPP